MGGFCVLNEELSSVISMFSSPFLVESGGKNTLEVPVNDPDLGHCFERE